MEQALGIAIPTNARLIRNILAGTVLVRDHVMSLYQGSLPDWVDASAVVTADPAKASQLASGTSAWPKSSVDYFVAMQQRLSAVVQSGRPGPFAPAWPGHPAYRLSPAQSLVLMAHMVEALDWQRDFMRLMTLLSGKDAHPQTYLVGGMALAPPWGGPAASQSRQHPQVPDRNAPRALSDEGIELMRTLAAEALRFVVQVLLPDTDMLLTAYPEWVTLGTGPGGYLCHGEFPLDDDREPSRLFPNGRLTDGNLERSDPVVETQVAESVAHSWYTYDNGDNALRRPMEGQTTPTYTGQVPLAQLSDGAKYSWVKAPRLDGLVMETGALARVLVAAANGQPDVRVVLGRQLTATGISARSMGGALGRALARSIEAEVVVRKLESWLFELKANLATGDVAVTNIERWDPSTWPEEAEGWSLGEGPRGSIGHWLRIRDAVIDHYQVVDGSAWNISPRDSLGMAGPIEAALTGIEVADPARPVELLRVIHSFAPCAACAAHVVGPGPAGSGGLHVHALEGIR